MPRKPMITRTIKTTKANVLCLNIEQAEPFNEVVTLPRTYKTEKDLMKAVEAVFTDPNVKPVHVVDTRVEEAVYGMTEQAFIENSEIIPAKNTNTDND